ncbi:MAG: hypothetical protein HDQ93_06885 [Desulfovibrio sp.]|nr:hypothetical protein [Desulfovibrio sp.]
MALLQEFLEAYQATGNVEIAERQSGYKLLKNYPSAGFYVYALIDPRDKSIFYIGKGIGGRVLKHEERTRRGVIQNRKKVERIQAIFAAGLKVEKRILAALESEELALALEDHLIDALRYSGLTNIMRGSTTSSPKVLKMADALRERIKDFKQMWLAE